MLSANHRTIHLGPGSRIECSEEEEGHFDGFRSQQLGTGPSSPNGQLIQRFIHLKLNRREKKLTKNDDINQLINEQQRNIAILEPEMWAPILEQLLLAVLITTSWLLPNISAGQYT